jgi:hypothetical protein
MQFDDLLGADPRPTAEAARAGGTAAAARRVRSAREGAGYETASAAALAFGWAPSRYLAHESGDRPIHAKQAAVYAQAFGIAAPWLMTGAPEAQPAAPPPSAAAAVPSEAMRRAARQALFARAVARGLIPASVPAEAALQLAETWRELADAAVEAAWAARR